MSGLTNKERKDNHDNKTAEKKEKEGACHSHSVPMRVGAPALVRPCGLPRFSRRA